MAKTKVSEWDVVATNNTDIDGINIANDCPPSYVNDAMREMMAQIKDWQLGAGGDPLTVSGAFTATGATNITGSFAMDGALGTNGQVLTSVGSSATPVWTTLPKPEGDMANQDANNVNITGGNISVTNVTANTVSSTSLGVSNQFSIGSGWKIYQSGASLYFQYDGNNVMKIDNNGAITTENNVTAFKTV
jgi:hypothetical protein